MPTTTHEPNESLAVSIWGLSTTQRSFSILVFPDVPNRIHRLSLPLRLRTQALVSKEDLAAQGVLLSAYSIVFTAALSISIAATVRVGNLLGAGDAPGARRAAHSAFHLALGIALFFALGLYLGREIWPIPYRTIDAVTNKIICLAPIYAVVQVGHGVRKKTTLSYELPLKRSGRPARGVSYTVDPYASLRMGVAA